MSKRFFVDSRILGREACLAGAEAHHVVHVMRGRVGDDMVLFDGSGNEFLSRIVRLTHETVLLEVLASTEMNRELPVELILGVVLPKGDRQRWLIEKAVELGVTRVVPLQTAHAVTRPEPQALQRLRRTVIEAAKQCGRNRLMEIAAMQSLHDFLASPPADALRLVADPAPPAIPLFAMRPPKTCSTIVLAVGPEGGFRSDEIAAASGWHRVSLGNRILRIETAALVLAAWSSQLAIPQPDAMHEEPPSTPSRAQTGLSAFSDAEHILPPRS
jgi:16S rRNA (uracil1498-N3)-methyltransferase